MRTVVFILLLSCVTASFAQQHFDSCKLSKYLQGLLNGQNVTSKRSASGVQHSASVCALMKMKEQHSVNDVASLYGCQVIDSVGQIYIVQIPVIRLGQMSLDNHVQRIESHEMPRPLMFEVPQHIGANKAWQGVGLPQAFTGKGVVAGIVDDGFDFTHPMFLDTLGNTRIRQFYDILQTSESGIKGVAYGPNEVVEMQHSSLAENEVHGTNVLSVMAGSSVKGRWRQDYYCGIAPESDIVIAELRPKLIGGLLNYDDGTTADCILGAKRVFDYADQQGKPCVVNFSLGFPMPIDDPCTLENEALEALIGPGHIIVAGAGNDGYSYGSEWQEIYPSMLKSESDKEVTASFYGVSDTHSTFSYADAIECYLQTSQPQEVRFYFGPDSIVRTIVVNTDQIDQLQGDTCCFVESLLPFASDTICVKACKVMDTPSYVSDDLYLFCITVGGSEVESLSSWLHAHQKKNWQQRYITIGDGVRVSVVSDYPCEMYTSPKFTPFIYAIPPYGEEAQYCINKQHAIAWPAASPSVIGVGALDTRSIYGVYLSETESLASFSSQGPTWSGLSKPDVCAPGLSIVVAQNSFGPKEPEDYMNFYDDGSDKFGNEGEMVVAYGTSIASPMVAGAIALWLQAKPDLTPDEVREILAHTCTHPVDSIAYPNNQYGQGGVDTYAGLLHILGIADIEGLTAHQPSAVRIQLKGKHIQVVDNRNGSFYDEPLTIKVYAVDGRLRVTSSQCDLDASTLPAGIYVVQVDSPNHQATGSTLIRL